MVIENIVREPAVTVDHHQDSMARKNEVDRGKETEQEIVIPGILSAPRTNSNVPEAGRVQITSVKVVVEGEIVAETIQVGKRARKGDVETREVVAEADIGHRDGLALQKRAKRETHLVVHRHLI